MVYLSVQVGGNRYPHNVFSGQKMRAEATGGNPQDLQVYSTDSKMFHYTTRLCVLSRLLRTGTIPEELGQLTALVYLFLNTNRLTGELFCSFSKETG